MSDMPISKLSGPAVAAVAGGFVSPQDAAAIEAVVAPLGARPGIVSAGAIAVIAAGIAGGIGLAWWYRDSTPTLSAGWVQTLACGNTGCYRTDLSYAGCATQLYNRPIPFPSPTITPATTIIQFASDTGTIDHTTLRERVALGDAYVRRSGTQMPWTVRPLDHFARRPQLDPQLRHPLSPQIDPNVVRALPGGKTDEAPEPDPEPQPEVATIPAYGTVTIGIYGNGGLRSPPLPPAPPRFQKPPEKNEKERKARSRSAFSTYAILKALDHISEGAEVVDCFFKALPKSVTKKWKKGRKSRGLLDNAGQYGINGADWKGQALWYNWDKVDVDKALKCVAANELQDAAYGAIYKRLPKNVGSALDNPLVPKSKGGGSWGDVLNAGLDQIDDLLGIKT